MTKYIWSSYKLRWSNEQLLQKFNPYNWKSFYQKSNNHHVFKKGANPKQHNKCLKYLVWVWNEWTKQKKDLW